MTEISCKVCLLGEFAVGKTSLVRRFCRQTFSERYLTTIGVLIETKVVRVSDRDLKLVIWDVAGGEPVAPNHQSYLRGAAGFMIVADGTRAETLDFARRAAAWRPLANLPWVGLVNKADLRDRWEVSASDLATHQGRWLCSSALTGEGVEEAFLRLAAAIEQNHAQNRTA